MKTEVSNFTIRTSVDLRPFAQSRLTTIRTSVDLRPFAHQSIYDHSHRSTYDHSRIQSTYDHSHSIGHRRLPRAGLTSASSAERGGRLTTIRTSVDLRPFAHQSTYDHSLSQWASAPPHGGIDCRHPPQGISRIEGWS